MHGKTRRGTTFHKAHVDDKAWNSLSVNGWRMLEARAPAAASPVRVNIGDAGEQPERAAELRVDAIIEQHEFPVRRREAELPHRIEFVQLRALVKVAVIQDDRPEARSNICLTHDQIFV